MLLTVTLGTVNRGLTNIVLGKEGGSLDIVPVLAGKRIDANLSGISELESISIENKVPTR